ncbi:hypothetical protein BDZ91DRAFT_768263 [Kalaharituber pfeilii]|nr:hypothetical protein BDZ91DRAFT_768263 [Kalaharituber pfeilii]
MPNWPLVQCTWASDYTAAAREPVTMLEGTEIKEKSLLREEIEELDQGVTSSNRMDGVSPAAYAGEDKDEAATSLHGNGAIPEGDPVDSQAPEAVEPAADSHGKLFATVKKRTSDSCQALLSPWAAAPPPHFFHSMPARNVGMHAGTRAREFPTDKLHPLRAKIMRKAREMEMGREEWDELIEEMGGPAGAKRSDMGTVEVTLNHRRVGTIYNVFMECFLRTFNPPSRAPLGYDAMMRRRVEGRAYCNGHVHPFEASNLHVTWVSFEKHHGSIRIFLASLRIRVPPRISPLFERDTSLYCTAIGESFEILDNMPTWPWLRDRCRRSRPFPRPPRQGKKENGGVSVLCTYHTRATCGLSGDTRRAAPQLKCEAPLSYRRANREGRVL